MTDLSIALTRTGPQQQASMRQAFDSRVISAMGDTDPQVAILACHLASLHRIQEARAKALELLISPNASLRRSAAEILGRIGIQTELPEILQQINNSQEDRTLRHSLIYAMIEGAQDRSLLEALDQAMESRQIFASTAALVRVLEHRGKLTELYGDLVLQLALVERTELSELGLSVLESHPQWSKPILDAVAKRMEKSKSTVSQPLLALLARWSDNPDVAIWVAENWLANDRKDPAKNASSDNANSDVMAIDLLSKLDSKPVPETWSSPISKLIEQSPENLATAWQSALQNRNWKGNPQAIQDAIGSKLRKLLSSDLQPESKTLEVLQWAAAMPKGSVIDEQTERSLIQIALASATQDASDSNLHRPLAWQSLSKLTLRSESARELLIERLANAGPLELP
ncbi:MAG: hypothetical protein ACKO9Q_14640, partial [Pirellula sp.]